MAKKKLKLSKMNNKEKMLSALKSIEDLGYHIADYELGKYYFIFDGEKDSICHFHIKEIPRFSFCILEYK